MTFAWNCFTFLNFGTQGDNFICGICHSVSKQLGKPILSPWLCASCVPFDGAAICGSICDVWSIPWPVNLCQLIRTIIAILSLFLSATAPSFPWSALACDNMVQSSAHCPPFSICSNSLLLITRPIHFLSGFFPASHFCLLSHPCPL